MKENFRSGFELEVKMKLLQRGMKQTDFSKWRWNFERKLPFWL
nr:MAG TPA: hypothetical protein [Caudoviricetes sp.]